MSRVTDHEHLDEQHEKAPRVRVWTETADGACRPEPEPAPAPADDEDVSHRDFMAAHFPGVAARCGYQPMSDRQREDYRFRGRLLARPTRPLRTRLRGRGEAGRPRARRRCGASSRTSSSDPGDGEPEPEPSPADVDDRRRQV